MKLWLFNSPPQFKFTIAWKIYQLLRSISKMEELFKTVHNTNSQEIYSSGPRESLPEIN